MTRFRATVAFQFTVLIAIIGLIVLNYIFTHELSEVLVGAMIGTFTGIPQALEREVKKDV